MYIFGYGSLIAPQGINNRGMKRIYTNEDLTETVLYNYKREYNAACYGNLFLGIIPKKGMVVNGVYFEVSKQDLIPFNSSEGFDEKSPPYNLIDVTGKLDIAPTNGKVFACVTKNPNYNTPIAKCYKDLIKKCLLERSNKFQKEFYV